MIQTPKRHKRKRAHRTFACTINLKAINCRYATPGQCAIKVTSPHLLWAWGSAVGEIVKHFMNSLLFAQNYLGMDYKMIVTRVHNFNG